MSPAWIGAAGLRSLELQVTERDTRILQSIGEHQFLTTGHIHRLHFASHASPLAGIRACVRVLDRLRRLGLVTRLQRTIGGQHAGSRAFVWCLDGVGNRLLQHLRGVPVASTRRRYFEPSLTFLEHTLAVAETRVRLEEASREGHFELQHVETEPAAWRHYVDRYGRPAVLKPDLGAVTAIDDFEDHWYIEVDRSTEGIRTLLGKCAQYEAYRATGNEQTHRGVFPIVIWLVHDERRRHRLQDEISSSRTLDSALFRVALLERLEAIITDSSAPDDATTSQGTTKEPKGGTL